MTTTARAYRALDLTLDGETRYPAIVALSDGSQPMTDTRALGWAGDPIPRWNGWVAFPLFDRETVETIKDECADMLAAGYDTDYLTWEPRCSICGEDGGAAGTSMAGYVHKYGPTTHPYAPAVLLSSTVYEADAALAGETYEPERIEPEIIDGTPRWCIGGCSWTWSEYVLSDAECEAIGADGRDGRGEITSANLTETERAALAAFRAAGGAS